MSRSFRWNRSTPFALIVTLMCVMIVCVAALGEQVHDHRGCQLDSSLGCSVCSLAFLMVVGSTALLVLADVTPRRHAWATVQLLIPSGEPLGQPTARGPPAR